jgi:hypothetical protein
MARGFAVPVRVNRRGGALLIQGTPYTDQIVRTGLTPNLSRNPFLRGDGVDVGVSERTIFKVNSPAAVSAARRDVTRFFRRVRAAGIARLDPEGGIEARSEAEELIVNVRYIDVEADDEREFEGNLKDSNRTGDRR